MHISETFRFGIRQIFLPLLVVVVILIIIALAFPTFGLTFKEFTLVYWILSIISFPLNYQAMRWTKYVVKHYGLQKEKNPVVKKMLARGDLKGYWISWLGMYLFIFPFFNNVGINAYVSLPFLILPSWILAIVLYVF